VSLKIQNLKYQQKKKKKKKNTAMHLCLLARPSLPEALTGAMEPKKNPFNRKNQQKSAKIDPNRLKIGQKPPKNGENLPKTAKIGEKWLENRAKMIEWQKKKGGRGMDPPRNKQKNGGEINPN
jgi:hypothetical protein